MTSKENLYAEEGFVKVETVVERDTKSLDVLGKVDRMIGDIFDRYRFQPDSEFRKDLNKIRDLVSSEYYNNLEW